MTAASESELVVVEDRPAPIVRVASIEGAVDALREYQRLQKALDSAMPECRMKIQGRWFRKKDYWRAVKTAFNLSVQLVSEERFGEGEDWGYSVVYSATAPNGASCCGDGACEASEKTGKMRTVHNVRAHAHTRAMNRAISNLVGFGEVSAEEMQHERGQSRRAEPRDVTPPQQGKPRSNTTAISDAQRKLLFAKSHERANELGIDEDKTAAQDILRSVIGDMGWESTTEIKRESMDGILSAISKWEVPRELTDAEQEAF